MKDEVWIKQRKNNQSNPGSRACGLMAVMGLGYVKQPKNNFTTTHKQMGFGERHLVPALFLANSRGE